jgi:hypothetical protein
MHERNMQLWRDKRESLRLSSDETKFNSVLTPTSWGTAIIELNFSTHVKAQCGKLMEVVR